MRIKPIKSINELLKNDNPYLLKFHPVIVGRSTWQRVIARIRVKAIRVIGAFFLIVSLASPVFASDYVSGLCALIGTPYAKLNCYEFIIAAHGGPRCTSVEMFSSGCDGRMKQIGGTYKDLIELSVLHSSELQAGDVICFRGGHVAVYLSDDVIIDSGKDGVHKRSLLAQMPFDPWYHGPIRVMRWR
jgi:hypothetical protein